jgi:hypothetical protein
MTNIAIGGGGLLLLAGAGLVFMRRRSAAGAIDPSVFENPLGEDNPFAELDPDVAAEQAEAGIDIPDATFEPENDDAAVPAQEGTDMDMATENTTIMDNAPDGIPAGGDDVSRMVAEFERRMKTMETRIDDLVDAKERLERQVAAQTEELRVQRAAIARTQRAVRNMGRAGESAPTEPALRDPARPEGPRQE